MVSPRKRRRSSRETRKRTLPQRGRHGEGNKAGLVSLFPNKRSEGVTAGHNESAVMTLVRVELYPPVGEGLADAGSPVSPLFPPLNLTSFSLADTVNL